MDKIKTHDEFMKEVANTKFSLPPLDPLPASLEAPKKKGGFKRWFFKGRIEKKEAKKERIEILSKEYDEGKVLRHG